jgi:hypothetical protein
MRLVLLTSLSAWLSTSVIAVPSEQFNRTPSSVTRILFCGVEIASSGIHDDSLYAGSQDFTRKNDKLVEYVNANAQVTITYRFCNADLKIDVDR